MRKIYFFFTTLIIFLILFFSLYFIHIKFFVVKVLFYSTLLDIFISSFIMLILYFFYLKKFFNHFEFLNLFIIFLLLSYCIAISIPTVIDRSLSFYILEKIDQKGGQVNVNSLSDMFIFEYMPEFKLIDIRLTEQLNSGTLILYNDCLKLTKKGSAIVKFSLFFRHNLLPKKRLIIDNITDELLNPFNNSKTVIHEKINYECNL